MTRSEFEGRIAEARQDLREMGLQVEIGGNPGNPGGPGGRGRVVEVTLPPGGTIEDFLRQFALVNQALDAHNL